MNIFGSSAINYRSNSPYIVLCHVCAHYLRTHMHVWPFSAVCRDLGPVCMPAYIYPSQNLLSAGEYIVHHPFMVMAGLAYLGMFGGLSQV